MAKGARLFPLQVTRLYERMVAVVDRKRKEPIKMYYKTKKVVILLNVILPNRFGVETFLHLFVIKKILNVF